MFPFFGRAAIYRWQQAMPPKMAMLRNVMVFINFLYTVLVLNYSCVGFMVFNSSLYFPRILLTIVSQSHSFVVWWCSGTELARNNRCLQECIFHRNSSACCCDSTQLLGSCEACETKDPERRINVSLFKTSDYLLCFFGPFMYTTELRFCVYSSSVLKFCSNLRYFTWIFEERHV